MNKGVFFPKLALVNLTRNGQFYFPYLLTVICSAAAYYIVLALASSDDLPVMTRYAYLSAFMTIGTFVIALFSVIFLTYTNGFLMKRRKRELGLYHVLGLGKGHIALMLGVETVYTAVAGIGGGLLLGLLLQKLVTLLLYKIMAFDAYFGFYVSWAGIRSTVILFSLILLGNLALNLLRMGRQNPVELLREGGAGEREPKTNWPAAILGVLALGGGYGIAIFARNAASAFALYFPAVFLVILGTYCLFSAISIAALKALRKNKGYYYQAGHFINISGMLYRMRRNAAGLANICILSTMVLVMVSGVLSLYLSSQRTLEKQFPGNVGVKVYFDPAAEAPFDSNILSAAVETALTEEGHSGTPVYGYTSFSFMASPTEDGYKGQGSVQDSGAVSVNLLTAADYKRIFGREAGALTPVTFRFPGINGVPDREATVNACLLKEEAPAVGGAFISTVTEHYLAVENDAALQAVCGAHLSASGGREYDLFIWTGFWSAEGTTEELEDLPSTLESSLGSALARRSAGSWTRLHVDTKENFTRDYYAINGGFFFLGLFLGFLFIMAAVLIIYYKQVSEGYEDRDRYVIMQKVGMEKALVRRCINSQILLVFFAPLIVAAVHVAFDYGLMVQLLTLFGLREPLATLACTVGTFLVFAALYALVYRATARTYYRIVEM